MTTPPKPGTLEYCQAKLNEWEQQAEAAKKERADLLARLQKAEQQLKDAVLLLTWPNTSADWRQRCSAFLKEQNGKP